MAEYVNHFLVVHPANVGALMALATPKERWKLQYRSQRMAAKGKIMPWLRGELGQILGFKVIHA